MAAQAYSCHAAQPGFTNHQAGAKCTLCQRIMKMPRGVVTNLPHPLPKSMLLVMGG